MITGLVRPDSGRILLDGKMSRIFQCIVVPASALAICRRKPLFSDASVEANIMSILQLVESDREAQRDKLENLLQEFSVTHVRKSAGGPYGWRTPPVEIARALASNPSFILLDEPFAGIDPIAISDIRELVAH